VTDPVYIVLCRTRTVLSRTIHVITREPFTHSGLAFTPELDPMFSFGRLKPRNPFIGGFKHERLDDDFYRHYTDLPGLVMALTVTADQRQRLEALVDQFNAQPERYGYNYFGLAGNLFGRSYQNPTRFFCSEFVYYVLHESGISDLGKPPCEVHPSDLRQLGGETIFEGNLMTYHAALHSHRNRT
jgi:hypothetical protein